MPRPIIRPIRISSWEAYRESKQTASKQETQREKPREKPREKSREKPRELPREIPRDQRYRRQKRSPGYRLFPGPEIRLHGQEQHRRVQQQLRMLMHVAKALEQSERPADRTIRRIVKQYRTRAEWYAPTYTQRMLNRYTHILHHTSPRAFALWTIRGDGVASLIGKKESTVFDLVHAPIRTTEEAKTLLTLLVAVCVEYGQGTWAAEWERRIEHTCRDAWQQERFGFCIPPETLAHPTVRAAILQKIPAYLHAYVDHPEWSIPEFRRLVQEWARQDVPSIHQHLH